MQRVFFYSLAVLGLVCLRSANHAPERRLAVNDHKPPGTDITVFSAGRGFDRQKVGHRRLMAAIMIDDVFLEHDRLRDGLWVATLAPDHSLTTVSSYDLSHSNDDIRALYMHCRNQRIDTVLVMCINRSIKQDNAVLDQVGVNAVKDLFTELRARAAPYEDVAASWSFVCIRRQRGWVPIAESYSPYTGTRLNVTLADDPRKYDRTVGRYVAGYSRPFRCNVHLLDFITSPEQVPLGVVFKQPSFLVSDYVDTILLPADITAQAAAPRRFLWPNMALGDNPRFSCKIRGERALPGPENALLLSLLVDGKQVAQERVDGLAGGTGHWREWHTAMNQFSGQTVDIELRLAATDPSCYPGVSLGDPALTYEVSLKTE